jgi:hypothetical protein
MTRKVARSNITTSSAVIPIDGEEEGEGEGEGEGEVKQETHVI